MENLPLVDRFKPTQQKRRIHQIILAKDLNRKAEKEKP